MIHAVIPFLHGILLFWSLRNIQRTGDPLNSGPAATQWVPPYELGSAQGFVPFKGSFSPHPHRHGACSRGIQALNQNQNQVLLAK